jgi:hypothetical protein
MGMRGMVQMPICMSQTQHARVNTCAQKDEEPRKREAWVPHTAQLCMRVCTYVRTLRMYVVMVCSKCSVRRSTIHTYTYACIYVGMYV